MRSETTTTANARQQGRGGETRSMASVPVTSTAILPSWITDISQAKLVQGRKERREYEDAIAARCAISGEDIAKAMMTVKSSFDHQLLKMMCKYDWIHTT
ncbi:hypothetical protein GN958_ATG18503 [Phytophthora infestans]|uniref:Uncharacterized protein n=1 Tax=Phytophthora infestans TaxID=4787 RepID=A0A8S9TUA2_PHYIN|nr:hypothetical protein GN958_ATG18503 [Phytophthora infestans]